MTSARTSARTAGATAPADQLAALLERQSLVIARTQALGLGMSEDAWRHRIGSGRWQQCGAGVAIAHSGTPERAQLEWAAVLHCGPGAALTGDAALVHLGVKRLTASRYDVGIPWARRVVARDLPGLAVTPHRLRRLTRWSSTNRPLRVVHLPASTLLAASWAPSDEEAENRIALVVQQGKSTPIALRTVLADLPRLPRHRLITEVLDDVEHGATARTELDYVRFCRRNDLPLPDEMQLRVRTGAGTRYLDAPYRAQRVLLEIDGAHHRWAAQWEADAMRSLQLAVACPGEQVLRITGAMLRHHEQETATLLRALLRPCAGP